MAEKDRTGEWVFDLFKDGVHYAQRSMTCGPRRAADAIRQWQINGYSVIIVNDPTIPN